MDSSIETRILMLQVAATALSNHGAITKLNLGQKDYREIADVIATLADQLALRLPSP